MKLDKSHIGKKMRRRCWPLTQSFRYINDWGGFHLGSDEDGKEVVMSASNDDWEFFDEPKEECKHSTMNVLRPCQECGKKWDDDLLKKACKHDWKVTPNLLFQYCSLCEETVSNILRGPEHIEQPDHTLRSPEIVQNNSGHYKWMQYLLPSNEPLQVVLKNVKWFSIRENSEEGLVRQIEAELWIRVPVKKEGE